MKTFNYNNDYPNHPTSQQVDQVFQPLDLECEISNSLTAAALKWPKKDKFLMP